MLSFPQSYDLFKFSILALGAQIVGQNGQK